MSNEEIEEYFSSLKTEVKEKVDFEEKLNALLKKDVKYHPQQLYFDFCQMEICENMKIRKSLILGTFFNLYETN